MTDTDTDRECVCTEADVTTSSTTATTQQSSKRTTNSSKNDTPICGDEVQSYANSDTTKTKSKTTTASERTSGDLEAPPGTFFSRLINKYEKRRFQNKKLEEKLNERLNELECKMPAMMCANMFRILAEKQQGKPQIPLQCIAKAVRNKHTCLANRDNMPSFDALESDEDICPVRDICGKGIDEVNADPKTIRQMIEFQKISLQEQARSQRIKDLQAQEKKYVETFERAANIIEKGENALIKNICMQTKQPKHLRSKGVGDITDVPSVCIAKGNKKLKASTKEEKLMEKIKCICDQNQELVGANMRNEAEIRRLQTESEKLQAEAGGMMSEKIQRARKKCICAENKIKELSKNFEDCASDRTRGLMDMKQQLDITNKKRGEIAADNRNLICTCNKLEAKKDHLDDKLTAQKQNEDVLLKNMNQIMCERGCGGMMQVGTPGAAGRSPKAQARACNLLSLAARLTEALNNVENCSRCNSKVAPELKNVVCNVKKLVETVDECLCTITEPPAAPTTAEVGSQPEPAPPAEKPVEKAPTEKAPAEIAPAEKAPTVEAAAEKAPEVAPPPVEEAPPPPAEEAVQEEEAIAEEGEQEEYYEETVGEEAELEAESMEEAETLGEGEITEAEFLGEGEITEAETLGEGEITEAETLGEGEITEAETSGEGETTEAEIAVETEAEISGLAETEIETEGEVSGEAEITEAEISGEETLPETITEAMEEKHPSIASEEGFEEASVVEAEVESEGFVSEAVPETVSAEGEEISTAPSAVSKRSARPEEEEWADEEFSEVYEGEVEDEIWKEVEEGAEREEEGAAAEMVEAMAEEEFEEGPEYEEEAELEEEPVTEAVREFEEEAAEEAEYEEESEAEISVPEEAAEEAEYEPEAEEYVESEEAPEIEELVEAEEAIEEEEEAQEEEAAEEEAEAVEITELEEEEYEEVLEEPVIGIEVEEEMEVEEKPVSIAAEELGQICTCEQEESEEAVGPVEIDVAIDTSKKGKGPCTKAEADFRKHVQEALNKANRDVMLALEKANREVANAMTKANKNVETAMKLGVTPCMVGEAPCDGKCLPLYVLDTPPGSNARCEILCWRPKDRDTNKGFQMPKFPPKK